MPVSTTATWTLPIDEIIDEANARVSGELSTGYDARRARRALNLLFQDIQLRGLNLWTVDSRTVTLVQGQAVYTLDPDVVDVLEAVIRDTTLSPDTDIIIPRMARDDYQSLPNKDSAGRPLQFYDSRERAAPVVTFWPVPDRAGYEFRFYCIRRTKDVDRMDYDVDAPVRWTPAIVSGLAYYLARGQPQKTTAALRDELEKAWEKDFAIAAKEDRDTAPIRIAPDLSCYGRP